MPTPTWGKTIVVFLHGNPHPIGSSVDALDTLLAQWPIADGQKYLLALEVCGEVTRGEKAENQARSAFILAAVEAGLYFEVK
jgi:hypothetical protein